MTPTTTASRSTASTSRRTAILDAALHLFATRGLAGTTVEDICSASGASNGSLYHHFGSKEGVAAAIYADAMADYQRGAWEVFRQAPTAEAGIRTAIEQFLDWVAAHPELAKLMLAVDHSDIRALAADRVAALNGEFMPEVTAWIDGHIAAGDLPPIPPDILVPSLFGPARRFAELWLDGATTTSLTEAAAALAQLAWEGFGGTAKDR